MDKNDKRYKLFLDILNEELLTAMGCTEPIALAFAAATARDALGVKPDEVVIKASGSMIKNSKSVVVPNTNHLKGMEAAVAIGIVAGDAKKQLEVIV
ncbi:MAG: serine dehydratase subunit alpha family protein, partial [Bacillota bacterium]|nr:serine dehydratase subunit alpha family protein [Bacillota bacterium]